MENIEKSIRTTEENFIDLIIGSKKFEIRDISVGIKHGDVITIEEYDDSTDTSTYRFATAEIGITQQIGNFIVLSIDIINYVDEKGIVHS